MSLLNLFSQQRKLWHSQATDRTADYQAGGLAALVQAEAAFKATPIYNVHQQLTETQRELEEVSHQLSMARQNSKVLENKLAYMTQRASEVVVAQELLDNARLHRNRMRSARRVMHRIVAAAADQSMLPETRLGKIVEIVTRFQAAIHDSELERGELEPGDA